VERDDGTPAKPDTTVVDVDLMACIYGTYLAMHYMHKNPNKKGKIVYTSSMCGLYSGDMIPLYTAAKHGVSFPRIRPDVVCRNMLLTQNQVVGLTYATARALKGRGEDITVNCICPGKESVPVVAAADSC
jgi:NAD(P)-dependent dehydrogenase (short-subunit alcohol dehydrogenase family)